MKIIIRPHSFIDLITNSSTELFILDIDKSLETIKEIIYEKEKEFPCEYGKRISINIENPYYYGVTPINDLEEALKYLKSLGYKIEAPEVEKEPEAIVISCETGCMHPKLIEFIRETFNSELINY